MTHSPTIETVRVRRRRLHVAKALHDFVNHEVLPGTGVAELEFWAAFDEILHKLTPENRALLAQRDHLQARINDWHRDHAFEAFDAAGYKQFLISIGYLEQEGPDFDIATGPLDPEMSTIAGPQLVVPLTNARYALNAANARWGSLYDAVYGTDMLPGPLPKGGYDSVRGADVIAFARDFLDRTLPLDAGSWHDVVGFSVERGRLAVTFAGDRVAALADPARFAGYCGDANAPTAILLENHGLHVDIRIDRAHPVGATDKAGISDVVVEAATTAIMDLEDSVATVDSEEKVAAYRNWLGLMAGTLTAKFEKGGRALTRTLAGDRQYHAPDGTPLALPGTALLLVRNVGLLLSTDAILLDDGSPAPEGIVDAMVTTAIGMHGLKRSGRPSSATNAIYIVKPKLHGPEEVAFTDRIFDLVEDALGLARHTVKIGLMDEERRTSVNLKACIRAASHRIAFINTGFLDRTGDEIHTSLEAGPMVPKNDMKNTHWFKSYEDRNVAIGLACGFQGRAQIGKGMWAKPDRMAELYQQKLAHAQSGANTAWVPSPTAAVIHALHYHQADVVEIQTAMQGRACPPVDDLLEIPVIRGTRPTEWDVAKELENNIQGILGYVVRWVDQGIGCSKVPDINNVGLMEDRATLRISSQHIANWLRHGVCYREQVVATLEEMARVVDEQNAEDENYRPMADSLDSPAFQAAMALIFQGFKQPNGYTELVLGRYRAMAKRGGCGKPLNQIAEIERSGRKAG